MPIFSTNYEYERVMDKTEEKQELTQFLPQKNLIYLRGYIMLIVGILISLGSIIAPDVGILSNQNAWVPVAAMVILLTGLVECFDTYISRGTTRFFVNLQFAILDTVFAWLVLFSLGYGASELVILIIAFLIIKGLFRMVAAYAGHFSSVKPTLIGGSVSLLMGLLLWFKWPGEIPNFILSLCLSIEVALRGWALISFARWLGKHKQ